MVVTFSKVFGVKRAQDESYFRDGVSHVTDFIDEMAETMLVDSISISVGRRVFREKRISLL